MGTASVVQSPIPVKRPQSRDVHKAVWWEVRASEAPLIHVHVHAGVEVTGRWVRTIWAKSRPGGEDEWEAIFRWRGQHAKLGDAASIRSGYWSAWPQDDPGAAAGQCSCGTTPGRLLISVAVGRPRGGCWSMWPRDDPRAAAGQCGQAAAQGQEGRRHGREADHWGNEGFSGALRCEPPFWWWCTERSVVAQVGSAEGLNQGGQRRVSRDWWSSSD